jgi:glycosyltransferase involved in cell wall biosynthesis
MEYLGQDKPVNKIQPLVSVVVITYNHKNYIKECLDSVLMQKTDFPYEIILGEDDSTDGTREICIDYAEKYPDKIRLFLRDEKDKIYINGKKTGRFNVLECYKDSRGEYIAICEGDDYWTYSAKLQEQVGFLELNQDFGLIGHGFEMGKKIHLNGGG